MNKLVILFYAIAMVWIFIVGGLTVLACGYALLFEAQAPNLMAAGQTLLVGLLFALPGVVIVAIAGVYFSAARRMEELRRPAANYEDPNWP